MSRRFASTLLVATLAAASGVAAAENDESGVSRALATPRVNAGAFCLWQASQFGATSTESAAWLVEKGSGVELLAWPTGAGSHRSAWRGDPPKGAVALVHTHPRADGPRPSLHDTKLAMRLGLPVSVLSREGVFTALPSGRVVQERTSDWNAAYRGSALRDCSDPEALAVAEQPARAPAPPTTSAASARAAGLDSWR
jgi:hypothetical protein